VNIVQLSQALTTFLSPFLPYLSKAGEKAIEEVGKKFGQSAWELAKNIWAKLKPQAEAKASVKEVIQDVAKNPSDERAQAVLCWHLQKLLEANMVLAGELASLLKKAQQAGVAGVNITATGERSVSIAGNMFDGIIITGDPEVVQHGTHILNIGKTEQVAFGARGRTAEIREVEINLKLPNGKYPTLFWTEKIGEASLLFGSAEKRITREWWEPPDFDHEQLRQLLLGEINKWIAIGWDVVENDLSKLWLTESNYQETAISSLGDLVGLPVGISWKNWRVYLGARFHIRRILD